MVSKVIPAVLQTNQSSDRKNCVEMELGMLRLPHFQKCELTSETHERQVSLICNSPPRLIFRVTRSEADPKSLDPYSLQGTVGIKPEGYGERSKMAVKRQ